MNKRTNFKVKRKKAEQEQAPFSFSTKSNRQIAESALEWSSLSDSGLRLRCGEMTAQEIRTVRAVLNCILGV